MEKLISILVFPIGLFLCFGPAIVVWLKEELGGEQPKPAQTPKQKAKKKGKQK